MSKIQPDSGFSAIRGPESRASDATGKLKHAHSQTKSPEQLKEQLKSRLNSGESNTKRDLRPRVEREIKKPVLQLLLVTSAAKIKDIFRIEGGKNERTE